MLALQYVNEAFNKNHFPLLLLKANRFWKKFSWSFYITKNPDTGIKKCHNFELTFGFNVVSLLRNYLYRVNRLLVLWQDTLFLLTHFNTFCFSFGSKSRYYHRIWSRRHMEMCFPDLKLWFLHNLQMWNPKVW